MALNENLKMKVDITDLCAGSLEEPDAGKLVTIGVLKKLMQDEDSDLNSIDDIVAAIETLQLKVETLPAQDTTYDLILVEENTLQLKGSDGSVDEIILPEEGVVATDENGAVVIGPTSIKEDSPLYDFIEEAIPAKAISDGSVAFGLGTQAGVRGYYWYELRDNGNGTYTFILSNKQNELDPVTDCDWQLDDYLCFVNEHKYYCVYQILTVNSNEITFQGPLPTDWIADLRTTKTDPEPEEFSIFAVKLDRAAEGGYDKPIFRSGSVIFGWSAFVAGLDNFAVGSLSTVFGYRNIANDYGFATGRNNVAGYGSIVGGWNNLGLAQKSLIVGRDNVAAANADDSIVGGYNNTLLASRSVIGGKDNTIGKEANYSIVVGDNNNAFSYNSAIFGDYNNSTALEVRGGRALIAGNSNDNTGDFNIIAGRDNTVNGSYNAVFGGYHKNENAETGHSISGKYATVGGAQHTVEGNGNTVFGAFNKTTKGYCLVAGRNCAATREGQVVLGKYNDVNDNAALIIGAGSSSLPKNIFTISADGRITAGAAPDVDNPNGLDVVTVDYLKNYLLDKEW